MAALAKNRFTIFLVVVAVVLFISGAVHQGRAHSEQIGAVITSATSRVWPLKGGKSFYEIAQEKGTDKVTVHTYHEMYEKYLPPLRNKKIKMLEIGLGCDMVSILGMSIDKLKQTG
jgi:hypothetical protein